MKKTTMQGKVDPTPESPKQKLMARKSAGDDMAHLSMSMAEGWPRPTIRQRELPAFSKYYFSQRHLTIAAAMHEAPPYHHLECGEAVYDKWALALWFADKGHETREEPYILPYHDRIPKSWFMDDSPIPPCGSQINAYEVILHRKAEESSILAQNLLILAVHWPNDMVCLEELEKFTDGLISLPEFTEWSTDRDFIDGQGIYGAFYDKWELMFWLFENIDRLPQTLFELSSLPMTYPLGSIAMDKPEGADPFDDCFWKEVSKSVFISPRTYGWSNQDIMTLYVERRRALMEIQAKNRKSSKVIAPGQLSLMAEKIFILMGHDLLEVFRVLIRTGYGEGRDAPWCLTQWFHTLARTVPVPLSVWNRLT